jgi:hypothetical protein
MGQGLRGPRLYRGKPRPAVPAENLSPLKSSIEWPYLVTAGGTTARAVQSLGIKLIGLPILELAYRVN